METYDSRVVKDLSQESKDKDSQRKYQTLQATYSATNFQKEVCEYGEKGSEAQPISHWLARLLSASRNTLCISKLGQLDSEKTADDTMERMEEGQNQT